MLIVSYTFILSPSPKMSYLRLEHVFYYLTLISRNHVFYEIAAPSDNSKYLFPVNRSEQAAIIQNSISGMLCNALSLKLITFCVIVIAELLPVAFRYNSANIRVKCVSLLCYPVKHLSQNVWK